MSLLDLEIGWCVHRIQLGVGLRRDRERRVEREACCRLSGRVTSSRFRTVEWGGYLVLRKGVTEDSRFTASVRSKISTPPDRSARLAVSPRVYMLPDRSNRKKCYGAIRSTAHRTKYLPGTSLLAPTAVSSLVGIAVRRLRGHHWPLAAGAARMQIATPLACDRQPNRPLPCAAMAVVASTAAAAATAAAAETAAAAA